MVKIVETLASIISTLASLFILAEIQLAANRERMAKRLIIGGIILFFLSIVLGIGVYWLASIHELEYNWTPFAILITFSVMCFIRGLVIHNPQDVAKWLDQITLWAIIILAVVMVGVIVFNFPELASNPVPKYLK